MDAEAFHRNVEYSYPYLYVGKYINIKDESGLIGVMLKFRDRFEKYLSWTSDPMRHYPVYGDGHG